MAYLLQLMNQDWSIININWSQYFIQSFWIFTYCLIQMIAWRLVAMSP